MGMSGGRSSWRYRACVSRYLVSPAGRNTAGSIALRLLKIEPEWLALAQEPLHEEIHATRVLLENLETLAGERANDWDPEETGVRTRTQDFHEKLARSKFE
jgi:hypothetical protein